MEHRPLLRRSKVEQRLDLLLAILGGESKQTRILSLANLSNAVLLRHLAWLQSQGLVKTTRIGLRTRYALTPFGEYMAKVWRDVILGYLVPPGEETSTFRSRFAGSPTVRRRPLELGA